ncbi:NUDIX hydrolase [Candidatus Falkowbacteria bacterium]|nr:NUDIX hydrolase [Candidatus Falkowbacteria bacterium]
MPSPNFEAFEKATDKWKLLVAADVVAFTFFSNELKVLLVKRKYEPGVGQWAIPGGFVRENESLEEAAIRELKEETGLSKGCYLEQLYTFGAIKRDPRARVISVAFLVLIAEPEKIKLKASDDAMAANWFSIAELPALAFGESHREILLYAAQRLRWKFEYTNVAFSLLRREFTLTELQRVYEAIYGRQLDKRNFRKKILSLDLIETVDDTKQEFGRPAQLYKARAKKLKIYQKII